MRGSMQNSQTALQVVTMLVCLLVAGCGGGSPLVPVSGTVTFDGGTCPAPGNVIFKPVDVVGSAPSRPGRASFGSDGTFVVTSFQEGDGLLPGTYMAEVSCDRGVPNFNSPTPWEDITYLGPGYEPKQIVVTAGSPAMAIDLDVPGK